MVYVADKSLCGEGFREANQQLAAENSELRQVLGQIYQDISKQRTDLLQQDLELIRLRSTVDELLDMEKGYIAIKEIMVGGVQPVEDAESRTKSIAQAHNEDGKPRGGLMSISTSTLLSHCSAVRLSIQEEEDTLEPPNESLVPIDFKDNHNPQIVVPKWDCQDSFEARPNHAKLSLAELKVMFQSTPVQSNSAKSSDEARERASTGSKREPIEVRPVRYNLRKRAKI